MPTDRRFGCCADGGADTDVGRTLEDEGVASFHDSFQDVLGALDTKARQLATR